MDTQLSFWIPIDVAKICFFRIVINCEKYTSVLGGTILKKIKNCSKWRLKTVKRVVTDTVEDSVGRLKLHLNKQVSEFGSEYLVTMILEDALRKGRQLNLDYIHQNKKLTRR